MTPEEVISEICRVADGDGNAKVYLYGSRARGCAHKRSDFDIAVENATNFDDFCTEIDNIPTLYKIDVLDLDYCCSKLLREEVLEHGYDIHEALGQFHSIA